MIKYLILFLIIIHGLIHIWGLIKAFKLATVGMLTREISGLGGIIWTIATVFFLFTSVIFLLNVRLWLILLALSYVLSIILIIAYWKDAKFRTVSNVLLIAAIILLNVSNY